MFTLNYFYGNEAEQFSFFRIPKILFKDKRFKDMSTDAKLLYGLMLDRMGLSVKNQWSDESNRVYIIYTMTDITDDLGCAKQKAAKLLDELENGIGLIERKRQGLGKPNIIYVKNFIYEHTEDDNKRDNDGTNIESQEVCKSNLQKYENQTSGSLKIIHQEVRKSNSNNTNINNTNINNTKKNNTDFNDTILSYPIEEESITLSAPAEKTDMIRWIRERNTYEQLIKDNIDYDIIAKQFGAAWLDEIVALMVDVVCSKEPYIRINKQDYPQEVVKSRFLKIDSSHIEYIYFSLKENTSNVRNIRAFLITTIYRASETTDNWFSAKVCYDMNNNFNMGGVS